MIRTGFHQSKRSQFRCYSTFVRPKGTSDFLFRHIGPQPKEIEHMLRVVGPFDNLDTLTESIIPSQILQKGMKAQFDACSEANALQQLEKTMMKNRVNTSCIGEGYFGTHLPSAIQRNLLENPAWYTPYTPYQAEISQGRLESLMNFQTMICELTRMELCNASLLDEATAAAEAAFMCSNIHDRDASKRTHFIVDSGCYQRTIEMVKTRCEGKRIKVTVMALEELVNRDDLLTSTCGVLIQYPNNIGKINTSLPSLVENLKRKNVLLVAAVDLLALTRVIPPGELGFDICVGTAQRFGVPMGFGGPHAAYLATKDSYKRAIPGRIIGRSRDATGQPALRMALQTREQHIRRAKASSNICTAQALLANISAFYGIYHGPEGLQRIAERVHNLALNFHALATKLQVALKDDCFFDTVYLAFRAGEASNFNESAMKNGINVRMVDSDSVCVSFDETTEHSVLETLKDILRSICDPQSKIDLVDKDSEANSNTLRNNGLIRKTPFMLQPVFNMYHSETALMRYMNSLCRKDYGLTVGMIPLGSCTMKLNSASELIPLTWKTISSLHPFCPSSQSAGYQEMLNVLRERLAELMGFDDVLLQPNSGAQGEYAGLRAIRAYHESRNEGFRDKCFVLQSAHGTNPASAVMAGLVPIEIKCLGDGTTDINDLKSKIEQHSRTIACIMITYPSTYGIFEPEITHICDMIHSAGGQVYIDGANLNAMVGLATPGDIGGDVAHTNLHKTFAIPHGGGGPGQGPIGVKKHLIPFLPGNEKSFGAVSQAFYGSASILNISYMYLQMMGSQGLRLASQVAILSANYLRVRLMKYYPILFCSGRGCAHEFILDLRKLKQSSGVDAEDVAKRLMDYNFHAPTLSFPIPNTIMIEPTESEPLSELDRLADALIAIRSEIQEIENGAMPREKNVLKNAPHTQDVLVKEIWNHPYTREKAVFPNDYVRKNKFWPSVSRIDGTWGDKNFRCTSCT